MLQGIRVLDLTRYLPGPYATRLLCDFGADVIKVEGPASPDPLRAWPPVDAEGVSPAFRALNRGKRGLAIDLKSEEGSALFLRLVEEADVLVEGFRPGTMERLGLGPEACKARNERLVYCSISGFGQDGPYRDRPGHDVDYLAYSGVLSVSVDRGGESVLPGLQIADTLGAYGALVGILGALLARERTGVGRTVDASMLDALVSAQTLELVPHLAGARAEPGHLPLAGGYPCYGVYATADDRAVALGALEPKFWSAFCEEVERPAWIERQFDPKLIPEVDALFRSRARDAWAEQLEDKDVCLAPVLEYDELASNPQIRHRGLLEGDRLTPPLRFEPRARVTPTEDEAFAARVGEHTREVLTETIGLSEEDVQALAQGGIVSCP